MPFPSSHRFIGFMGMGAPSLRMVRALSRPEMALSSLTESFAEKSLNALPTPILADLPWGNTHA